MLHLWRQPRTLLIAAPLCLITLFYFLFQHRSNTPFDLSQLSWSSSDPVLENITITALEYVNTPIQAPYKGQFWETGQRSRRIIEWLEYVDKTPEKSKDRTSLLYTIDEVSSSLFSFVPRPDAKSRKPRLTALRNRYDAGSRGIVMPVGGSDSNIRFAGHLIASLREVLGCKLPIEIAYAGDHDLPPKARETLASFDGTGQISFLNVWDVFDDAPLRLRDGGWAIKPFAVLASRFEQVILVDADSVFLQNPENLFRQKPYLRTGAYMFHDRLLWQYSFGARHRWWHDQIKEPSAALDKSLVWVKDWSEECDSGVVVLDKSRLPVFVGLAHVAWQNTFEVREEVTYKLTYGDKESWWLGMELVGATYEFEEYYGSMLGWESKHIEDGKESPAVCSFVIAHLDDEGRLLWYNGSLLKNKVKHPQTYDVPEAWMMDGTWKKGTTKGERSCMVDSEIKKLSGEEHSILERSIAEATRVDSVMKAAQ